jgi:pimeloyl-ACP methyl ester carboxylesterase
VSAESADVIALDQRGMGRSLPRLDCPGNFDLPLDRPMERNFVLAAFRERAGECRAYWTRRGVDLAFYNTNESARDLEDLRGRKLAAKFLRGDSVSNARLAMPPFGFRVPGLTRDAAIAAQFGRSLRPPPGYTGSGN